MTRWARVGNSQKHEKLPEDATPWEEFWENKNKNSSGDAHGNKVKSGRIEKKKQKQKKKFGFDVKSKVFENAEKNISKFRDAEQEESENNNTLIRLPSSKNATSEEHLTSEYEGLSKKQLKKAKKKAKLQQLKNTESNTVSDNNTSNVEDSIEVSQQEESENNNTLISSSPLKNATSEEYLSSEFQGLSKKQLKKAKKKAKLQQLEKAESKGVQDNSSSNVVENIEVSQADDKSPKEKDFQGKKKLFMKKLEQKRKENGILLLPAKIERKLYIIKKRLREKGLPPAAIKDIARKERRKEELKFRRTMSTKPCFNCRQTGHLLAECPMPLGNSNQETGLCFKCGAAGHTSYKCPEKIEGYPLAKCFVCKEQGHISKDCPKNEHGVYIKGGKCGLCGNVNHLKKDCPTLKKKNDEEADITAYTINEDKSVDAEIITTEDVKPVTRMPMKKGNKAKLVKF